MAKSYDPAQSATELLDESWDGVLPVDPVVLAHTLGIQVLNASLSEDVSGALVKRPGTDPSILLNKGDSKNRKRFTCAHELGHFIRRSDEPEQYEYVDYRDQLSATGKDEEERFANSFAANLLMPEAVVRGFHDEGLPEFRMAKRFGVSQEAMHFRLVNLGLT